MRREKKTGHWYRLALISYAVYFSLIYLLQNKESWKIFHTLTMRDKHMWHKWRCLLIQLPIFYYLKTYCEGTRTLYNTTESVIHISSVYSSRGIRAKNPFSCIFISFWWLFSAFLTHILHDYNQENLNVSFFLICFEFSIVKYFIHLNICLCRNAIICGSVSVLHTQFQWIYSTCSCTQQHIYHYGHTIVMMHTLVELSSCIRFISFTVNMIFVIVVSLLLFVTNRNLFLSWFKPYHQILFHQFHLLVISFSCYNCSHNV